jgi:hypothetical protein
MTDDDEADEMDEPEHPLAVFAQAEYWPDRQGVRHRVDGMSLEYLLNVLSYVEREAPRLWLFGGLHRMRADCDADMGAGDGEVDIETLAGDATRHGLAWIRATPLYRAVAAQADGYVAL